MRTEEPRPVRLKDYRPPDWLIETVALDVSLDATATTVRSKLTHQAEHRGNAGAARARRRGTQAPIARRSTASRCPTAAFSPRLSSSRSRSRRTGRSRSKSRRVIDPEANSQLMGLYRAGATYCTQCEAEGFRRITYFLDRPDVMAVYTTRIEADKNEAPVLLVKRQPHRPRRRSGHQPAFCRVARPVQKALLSVCAGRRQPGVHRRQLHHHVRPQGRARTSMSSRARKIAALYAMDSLKRAMRWDEEVFGREYDLDIFMIVAVSAFNMGAMENKGLNVFNDKYVLASPATATDTDYAHIEAVIAHEYFHNWTGDRITCRDWFQLCLKEGLTVFRDEEFSADQRSRAVERIGDVRALRSHQFVEDAGPARPSGAAGALSRDQQLLHDHDLRQGRRSRAHDQGPARARSVSQGHGSLFRPA